MAIAYQNDVIGNFQSGVLDRPQHLLGPLRLLAAPVGTVVTRKEVKDTARIASLKDDGMLDRAIRIGTDYVEKVFSGHRQLLTAQYAVPVANWWCGRLRIPRPPLQTIDAIYYFDTDGVQQRLDPSIYLVEIPWRSQGTVALAPYQTWPDFQCGRAYPIEIHFTCGYGTPAQIPDEIKYGVICAASQIYWGQRQVNQETMDTIEAFLEMTHGYGSYS